MSSATARRARVLQRVRSFSRSAKASSRGLNRQFSSSTATTETSCLRAAKEFKRSAGWRNSSQAVKGRLDDLHSVTESTAWGHYVGASVKLTCGDVIVGVPALAVRRWSVSSVDPVATSCAPADPYIGSDTPSFASLRRLSLRQRVTFAGRFCAIPDSVNNDVTYFVFSRVSPAR
jgi:hypothetical protein